MGKITAKYTGDLRVNCRHEASGTEIITDAPVDNRGKGQSYSPTDLFATSLASCILTIMGIRAMDAGIDIQGAEADVEKIMQNDPQRHVAKVRVTIMMPQKPYTTKEKKIIEAAAHHCPVALSIKETIEELTIRWP